MTPLLPNIIAKFWIRNQILKSEFFTPSDILFLFQILIKTKKKGGKKAGDWWDIGVIQITMGYLNKSDANEEFKQWTPSPMWYVCCSYQLPILENFVCN